MYRQCPEQKHSHAHVNFNEHQNENPKEDTRVTTDQHRYDFGDLVWNYNYLAPIDPDEQDHKEHLFLSLTHHVHHAIEKAELQTHYYERVSILPHLHDVLRHYRHLHPNLNVQFHGFWIDEGAPQSVTDVNQWIAYLKTFHLSGKYHDIHKLSAIITLGGLGNKKVETPTLEQKYDPCTLTWTLLLRLHLSSHYKWCSNAPSPGYSDLLANNNHQKLRQTPGMSEDNERYHPIRHQIQSHLLRPFWSSPILVFIYSALQS